MSEIIAKDLFEDLMKRNKFAIDTEGQVVCDHCRGDCGQCGAGGQMWQCQQYVDANPSEFASSPESDWRMFLGLLIAVIAIAVMWKWG